MNTISLTARHQEILSKAQSRLTAYASRFGHHTAEDIAQEWVASLLTRLQGHQHNALKFLEDIEPDLNNGVLPRCLKKEAIRRARRYLPSPSLSLELLEDVIAAKDTDPFQEPEDGTFTAMTNALPTEKQRTVVFLLAEGISQKEISRLLQVPDRTLRYWLHSWRERGEFCDALRRRMRPTLFPKQPG